MENADACPMIDVISSPIRTCNVDTTLSLAIKPDIRAVMILKSPSPTGFIRGTKAPAMTERILSEESVT